MAQLRVIAQKRRQRGEDHAVAAAGMRPIARQDRHGSDRPEQDHGGEDQQHRPPSKAFGEDPAH
jgi:hypothetical protein